MPRIIRNCATYSFESWPSSIPRSSIYRRSNVLLALLFSGSLFDDAATRLLVGSPSMSTKIAIDLLPRAVRRR